MIERVAVVKFRIDNGCGDGRGDRGEVGHG